MFESITAMGIAGQSSGLNLSETTEHRIGKILWIAPNFRKLLINKNCHRMDKKCEFILFFQSHKIENV
jgi:hypothetical protein